MSRLLLAVFLVVIALFTAPSEGGGTCRFVACGSGSDNPVCDARDVCATIQHAIDVAEENDIILVTGVCDEANVVLNKSLSVTINAPDSGMTCGGSVCIVVTEGASGSNIDSFSFLDGGGNTSALCAIQIVANISIVVNDTTWGGSGGAPAPGCALSMTSNDAFVVLQHARILAEPSDTLTSPTINIAAGTMTMMDSCLQGGAANTIAVSDGANLTLMNVTITNAPGVGVAVEGSVVMMNSTFTGCDIAVQVFGGNLDVYDCEFSHSLSHALNVSSGHARLYNSLFLSNSATGTGLDCCGGAILCHPPSYSNAATLLVVGCHFERNYAIGWGGGLELWYCPASLVNSSFVLNGVGEGGGGAIYVWANMGMYLTNVSFIGNSAEGANSVGGALYAGAYVLINACAFQGNSATLGGGAIYYSGSAGGITSTIEASSFIGNTGGPIIDCANPVVTNDQSIITITNVVQICGNVGTLTSDGTCSIEYVFLPGSSPVVNNLQSCPTSDCSIVCNNNQSCNFGNGICYPFDLCTFNVSLLSVNQTIGSCESVAPGDTCSLGCEAQTCPAEIVPSGVCNGETRLLSTPPSVQCHGLPSVCGTAPNIANGGLQCNTGLSGPCNVSCQVGYVASQMSVACGCSGWPNVTCTVITCPAPTPPRNGSITICDAAYDYASTCGVVCQQGFVSLGNTTCLTNGTWSPALCTAVTSPPPPPSPPPPSMSPPPPPPPMPLVSPPPAPPSSPVVDPPTPSAPVSACKWFQRQTGTECSANYGVVIAICAAVLLVGVLIGTAIRWYRRRRVRRSGEMLPLMDTVTTDTVRYSINYDQSPGRLTVRTRQSRASSESSRSVEVKIDTTVPIFNFNDLTVIRKIGEGGFAPVFLVRNKADLTYMACKVFKNVDSVSQAENFMRETQTMVNLHHPHCLRCLGVMINGSELGLLTEFMPGGDLTSFVGTRPSFAAQVEILFKVCQGLVFLHQRGMAHADIKLENILLDGRGGVQLADFGLVGLRGGACTPAYAAPEVIRGGAPSLASDMFSFGVLHVRLFGESTGRSIPDTRDPAAVQTLLVSVECPAELMKGVLACLSVAPGDRPTCSAMLRLLEKAMPQ